MTKKKSETKKDTETNEEKNILIEENVDEEKGADEISSSKEIGIFDEDLNNIDETDNDVSDFSIGDTILSSAPSVHGQHGRQAHNLEELAEREKTEDSKWKEAHDTEREDDSGKNFYGTSQKTDDLYQNGNNNQDLYNNRGGDLYNEGNNNLYSKGSKGEGAYDIGKSDTKSYGAFVDNRRSGRSMLEVAGFEDKEKQRHRNMRGLIKHEEKTN